MKLKLQLKDVFYTIESSLDEYVWIPNPKGKALTISTPVSAKSSKDVDIDKLTTEFEKLGGTWNIDKRKEYNKHQATALFYIVSALSLDNQPLINEHETAKAVWTVLKVKYSKTSELTANTYITKLTRFEFDKEVGIDGLWTKLKEYRWKLIVANTDMKNAYPNSTLLLILTKSLSPAYKLTTDGFRLQQSITVDEKLQILHEVEEDNKEQIEQAYIAKYDKYKPL